MGHGAAGPAASLITFFDLTAKEEHTFVEGIEQYDLSDDGTKVAYAKEGVITIADIGDAAPEKPTEQVHLSAVPLRVNLRKEWEQIFGEAWRLMRKLTGPRTSRVVEAMRKMYEPLVSRRAVDGLLHRADDRRTWNIALLHLGRRHQFRSTACANCRHVRRGH